VPQEEPVKRDVILVGGSAGSIESLRKLLRALPAWFPASLFVVVHTSAEGPGLLAKVLSRSSEIPAIYPADGDSIVGGQIYVAPPDYHLALAPEGIVRVRKGPRENGHRPAIDPLFRSAAITEYAQRTIAVVLSGYLDDGAAGLYAIRRRGGMSIVQDPSDALADQLPVRALEYAGADFVLPAEQIGVKLAELVDGVNTMPASKKPRVRVPRDNGKRKSETVSVNGITPNALVAYPEEGEGTPSVFACPECHGVLWEIKEGKSVRYRCRTGHSYSEATLNDELSRAGETALWAAMRALEEKASMARRVADSANGPGTWKRRLEEEAGTYATHAEILRKMILGEPLAEEELAPADLSRPA
jgi:two-component system chemotaxis response regulator CheB